MLNSVDDCLLMFLDIDNQYRAETLLFFKGDIMF